MMETKRIWFSKTGMLKYISHLDFSRYMSRLLKMTGLPLWYTEGFNPHLYTVFTLPLSLGMTGVRESLDVRMTAPVQTDAMLIKLNENPVDGLCFLNVTDPVMKPGEVAYASYRIRYALENSRTAELGELWESFSGQTAIIIEKKSKSGSRPYDLAPLIRQARMEEKEGLLLGEIMLPAGSGENVNPTLIGNAFQDFLGEEIIQEMERICLWNREKEIFK